MKYDYLVVGAGCFGATFAEHANRAGKKVIVIEARDHVGGNCYTKKMNDIDVHMYGAHIFHTNDEKIWNYVNNFTKFNNYVHKVKAISGHKLYTLPINMMTFYQLWGVKTPLEARKKLKSVITLIENPSNVEEWCLANLGEEIYETLIRPYTIKHWHMDPTSLPSSVIKRIPIRFDFNDNYFNDRFQGIPVNGYTEMFDKMLQGTEVKLSTPFEHGWRRYAKHLIYTGRIDELVGDRLQYLTIEFTHQKVTGDYQGTSVINYPEEGLAYSKCVEHKHFYGNENDNSIITYETSLGPSFDGDPYYPIPGKTVNYRELLPSDVTAGGRLGEYKYYDMHQAIGSAMSCASKLL